MLNLMRDHASFDFQPSIRGKSIQLRPLQSHDLDALYAIASDPLIWEQHPVSNRYQRDVYSKLFQELLDSKGTLVVIDLLSGEVIGCSRYYEYSRAESAVAIGYTMLARRYWGSAYNRELKTLMLDHAFTSVERVIFHAGEMNIRSQKALEKIGAIRFDQSIRILPDGREVISIHFQLFKKDYPSNS